MRVGETALDVDERCGFIERHERRVGEQLVGERLEHRLAELFGLEHSTLQVEHARGPVQIGRSFRRRSPLRR